MNKKILIGGLLAATLSGCATITPQAGFSDVQNEAAQRIDKRVHWRSGGPEDQAVDSRVHEMLAQELDIEQAVQIALLNNPRLQATYEELAIAQADVVQAGLLTNPAFTAAVLYPSSGNKPDIDLGISQDFLSVFYLPLRKRIAENHFEAAKLRVTSEVVSLAGEVSETFYRAQAASEMLELFDEVVRNTSASYVAAQELYEAGNITELALAQERAIYEESRLQLAHGEADFLLHRERLNQLMGLSGAQTQWSMSPRLPELPADTLDTADLEKRAIAANLALAAKRNAITSAAIRARFLNATALIPDVRIGLEGEREEEWEVGPSVRLQVPIFDFGQARRLEARAELRRARAEYAAQAIAVRSAVRASYTRLVSARDRAVFVRDVFLPLRNRIVAQALLQYNAMQLGVFQLLIAQRDEIAAARQYIETLRDYWIARSGLQQTLVGGMGREADRTGAFATRQIETQEPTRILSGETSPAR
jgi:cobalt-zinc-cadmium efflux system outer membrane protein